MRTWVLGFGIMLLIGGCGSDQVSDVDRSENVQEVPQYTAQEFFKTINYSLPPGNGHVFSSDGSQILLSSDKVGVFNAYALEVSDLSFTDLTQSTTDSAYGLSWFPDDDRILFTKDSEGDEFNHVYVRELDGTIRDLTPGEGLKADFLGWRDDGRAFFIKSNERDNQFYDIYQYNADTYDRELIYANSRYASLIISPDGRWVAADLHITRQRFETYIIDLQAENSPEKRIAENEGNIIQTALTFTPSSEQLIYATDEHGEFREAHTYDLSTNETESLGEADWDIMSLSYSTSGDYRVSEVNADSRTETQITNLSNNNNIEFSGLDGDIRNVRFNRSEDEVAFLVERDVSPPDIYIGNVEKETAQRTTNALNPEIEDRYLVNGDVVWFESYDGREIPGILYKPIQATAASPVPALVWIHGGPGGQSRKGYKPVFQHLVNQGYAVYAINNRGSSGYGKTFNGLDRRQHGEADLGDVVASRDFLASQDWIDGSRIGVMGQSYGGYLTTATMTFSPETFDVGVNIFGVTNWIHMLESLPDWYGARRDAIFDEIGHPVRDAERLRRISPLFHAENIRRPMLVVQGSNDVRVPQVHSDLLVEAMRANNVPVEYVIFPDEGHGFRKRENQITASEAYLKFLDRYLKDGE